MAIERSTAMRNAMLNESGFKGLINGGLIVIFSGTRPDSPDDSENLYDETTNDTGNKELCRITLSAGDYSFSTGTNGLNFDVISDGMVAKSTSETWTGTGRAICGTTGLTAVWFRFYASGGTVGADLSNSDHFGADDPDTPTKIRFDGSCGAYLDLKMLQTTIISGQSCTLDVFTVELGK